MASTLPAELVLLTLDQLNHAQPPAARQHNRNTLRLVCKAWYRGVDRWRELYLEGSEIGLVLGLLESDLGQFDEPIASRIRRLDIHTKPKNKLSSTPAALSRLLGLCPNVDELVLVTDPGGQVKSIGAALATALAKLKGMRHFTLDGPMTVHKSSEIKLEVLQR